MKVHSFLVTMQTLLMKKVSNESRSLQGFVFFPLSHTFLSPYPFAVFTTWHHPIFTLKCFDDENYPRLRSQRISALIRSLLIQKLSALTSAVSVLMQRCTLTENLWTALIQLLSARKNQFFRAAKSTLNSADSELILSETALISDEQRWIFRSEQRWFKENQSWSGLKQIWHSAGIFHVFWMNSAEKRQISEAVLFSTEYLWDFNPGCCPFQIQYESKLKLIKRGVGDKKVPFQISEIAHQKRIETSFTD